MNTAASNQAALGTVLGQAPTAVAGGPQWGGLATEIKREAAHPYRPSVLFSSHMEVSRAENGYLVRFARHQGDIAKTYIATSIEEVRTIIAAEMAVVQLEDK